MRKPPTILFAVLAVIGMAALLTGCLEDTSTESERTATPAVEYKEWTDYTGTPPEPETDCEASANRVLAEIDLYLAALDRFNQAADILDIPAAQTAYDEAGEHQEEIWWFGADLVSDDCRGEYDDLVAVVDQASRDWTALESVCIDTMGPHGFKCW